MKVLPSGRRKLGRLVEIIPDGKFTVCESAGVELGKVTKIFALKSLANTMLDKSLAELAKIRIEARANPSYSSLKEFYKIRNYCHLVEQVGHEYYCDCRIEIKGDLDKHCMALNFDRENFP